MQIVRRDINEKRNSTLSSFVRNTSCSRGWLRQVVQITFGFITVVSFILIVLMAFRGVIKRPPSNNNRCKADSCRVVCYNAPYYNSYEEDIINAAIDTEPNCERMFLTLKHPMFVNSTLPLNWLSSLRSNIRSLTIIGGNLKHIPPNAFVSTFATNVRTLSLEDVTLTNWFPETFIGLSNIQELLIKNTTLLTIHSGALKTIDDTLTTLDIKATNVWDPINVTGTANPEKLATVDFSKNIFTDILNKNSFSRLQNCKILYLNSCKISVIGNGTFDNLINIEILFLNNNFIHTVPNGLFSQILTLKHKPRINLQDNPWRCECTINELRKLHVHDLLIVEPSCYYPKEVQGLTFSEFENYCSSNDSQTQVIIPDINDNKNFNRSYQTLNIENEVPCDYDSDVDYEITPLISTSNEYRCSGFRAQNYKLIPTGSNSLCDLFSTDNKWLKPVFYSSIQPHSVIEISSHGPSNYGLLWYKANCPREIYCVSSLPQVLRIFNVNNNNNYIFCRFYNRTVLTDECVVYDFSKSEQPYRRKSIFLLCMITAIVCLSFGALAVYGLIRKNPGLLKGSKRVLFVKHKQVDALVLPPKVPLRNNQMKETYFSKSSNRNIFIMSPDLNNLPMKFTRMNSTRSTNSSNPSYISAIQPSEDQLAQWRLKHYLEEQSTVHSLDSCTSSISWIYDADPVPYFSLDPKEPTYEIVKKI